MELYNVLFGCACVQRAVLPYCKTFSLVRLHAWISTGIQSSVVQVKHCGFRKAPFENFCGVMICNEKNQLVRASCHIVEY